MVTNCRIVIPYFSYWINEKAVKYSELKSLVCSLLQFWFCFSFWQNKKLYCPLHFVVHLPPPPKSHVHFSGLNKQLMILDKNFKFFFWGGGGVKFIFYCKIKKTNPIAEAYDSIQLFWLSPYFVRSELCNSYH